MKKKQNTHNVIVPEVPAMINMETLSYVTDQDLESRFRALDSERQKVNNMGYDPYAWEVELAYVQREISIRESRRIAHENYIRNNPDAADMSFSPFDSDEYTVN